MSDSSDFKLQLKESPGIRLAVLFGSFMLLLIVSSIISEGVNQIQSISERNKLLITSLVQSAFVFILPAVIFAKYGSPHPFKWLRINRVPTFKSICGIIIVYFLSMPAMEWLIEWNQGIHFPQVLQGLENTLREWETNNEAISSILLSTTNVWQVIIGVLVIGFVTGFSEEIFFRGGFQGILEKTAIGNSTAVWIAAILFSTLHFQFFGFFPRLLMGVFFGYLLVWSGNLWTSIFAHALNNSIVVVAAGICGESQLSILHQGFAYPDIYLPIFSLIFTALFFILFRKYFFYSHR